MEGEPSLTLPFQGRGFYREDPYAPQESRSARAGFAVVCFLAVFAVSACAPETADRAPSPEIEISLTQEAGGVWRLDYDLAKPATRLDLGPSLNGFRARDWRVLTPGLGIAHDGGHDVLVSEKGRRFRSAAVDIHPHRNHFAKDYEPVASFADGGAILYTGHFWPLKEDGARFDAVFNFTPLEGGRVAAFGAAQSQARSWTSPYDHPAFVYVGQRAPEDFGGVAAIVDGAAPDWVAETLREEAPRLIAGLAGLFGRDLAAPDLFLLMGAAAEPGRLASDGDALPGQLAIALSGGAWAAPTREAKRILLAATAHEAAHLWQFAARPLGEDVPDWIHEGGADALAAEVLASLGAGEPAGLDAARADCRTALGAGSLDAAEAAGEWRASYACGAVLTAIAARAAAQGDASAFWRAFIARAEASGGYDEALFFSMIEEGAGAALASEVRRFPGAAYAAPDKELARLLEAADAAARNRPQP